MSWPDCAVQVPHATYGIVGVPTARLFDHQSVHCAQGSLFRKLSLYANSGGTISPPS